MTRGSFFMCALILSISGVQASPWPEFPQRPDPVTAQDVKDFWYEALPRPTKPLPLDPDYLSRIKDYQGELSTGRSLIRRLLAGFFDHEAELTAHRHNLALFQAGAREQLIAETEGILAQLESTGPAPVTDSPSVPASRLSRSSGLRLARLEPSSGVRPASRLQRQPSPPRSAPATTNPATPSPAPQPEIIDIEDDDDPQQVHDCPPRGPRPPHRPQPPLDITPYPEIPNPPSPPHHPPAPPASPLTSAPAHSSSFFNQSGRPSK